MRIVVVYSKPQASPYDAIQEQEAENSIVAAVAAVTAALQSQGHTVTRMPVESPLAAMVPLLQVLAPDLIFNLFEGFGGRPEAEAEASVVFRSLGVPVTGALGPTLALCLDKAKTKEVLRAAGVPTPDYQRLAGHEADRFSLRYPVIVKPVGEDASHGCTSESVVYDAGALRRQLDRVARLFGGEALVERFLLGREFNASLLGGPSPEVLPLSEIVFSDGMPEPKLLTYAAKWRQDTPEYRSSMPCCPAQVNAAMRRQIEQLALAAYGAVGSPPYARVDMRCDGRSNPYVLEVNPNPDISVDGGMALQATVAGLGYDGLIRRIVAMALEEQKSGSHHAAAHAR